MKQQTTSRHVATLEHLFLLQSQPIFAPLVFLMLQREKWQIPIWYPLVWPWSLQIKSMIFPIQDEHDIHYNMKGYNAKYKAMLCNLGVATTRKSKLGKDIENVVRQKLSLYFGHTVVSPFCKEKVVLKEEQTSLERDNLLSQYIWNLFW